MAGDITCPDEGAIALDERWKGKSASKFDAEHTGSPKSSKQPETIGGARWRKESDRAKEQSPIAPTDPNAELGSTLRGDVDVGDIHAGASPVTAQKAGPGEFELLKVIGMGAFGKVLQVGGLQQLAFGRLYHSLVRGLLRITEWHPRSNLRCFLHSEVLVAVSDFADGGVFSP